MTRALFEELVLFLAPFVIFALYLVLRRRNPFAKAHWNGQVPWLAIAGLLVVIAGLVYTGLVAERRTGAYVPPHLENGKLVPGQFK
ncbi:DUF6111 family protein [Chelatococcus sp. SYSU_G07232]|uniref:DUF6111 family protein n=1 Tax=Chelatococcus albus TaxID=3047466 RepID=A0ABT7AL47_9HYPH|nr:DUF6111 family protein [Chelatococcus sp. SYSU_G07232]MDJ1159326.1 DUF6111 family protein [Chelatococcus sp. SYSU_G07232]